MGKSGYHSGEPEYATNPGNNRLGACRSKGLRVTGHTKPGRRAG